MDYTAEVQAGGHHLPILHEGQDRFDVQIPPKPPPAFLLVYAVAEPTWDFG